MQYNKTCSARKLTLASACALTLSGLFMSAAHAADGLPTLEQKDSYKVGFAQTESNNPWRIAETQSMKSIAKECNWNLVYTNASGSAAKQVSDVRNMIAQNVDMIFLAPREERPLAPAVMSAKRAGIPVILLDRKVDDSIAKAGRDYVTFIGSDFVKQGQRAAEWLVDHTGGKAQIIELEGTTGSSPANDRKKGFDDVIADQSGMQIIASQSGDFSRDKGRQVMQTLLQAHPDVTAVYAHNDEMVMGAISALEAAGLEPGKDITLVSIDGTRDALKAITSNKLGATVQSSPFFGPVSCKTMKRYAAGEKIEPWVKVSDKIFTEDNAEDNLDSAF